MASHSSEARCGLRQTTRHAGQRARAAATLCIRPCAARDRPHRSGAARSRACAGRCAPVPELPRSSKTNGLWCDPRRRCGHSSFPPSCAEEKDRPNDEPTVAENHPPRRSRPAGADRLRGLEPAGRRLRDDGYTRHGLVSAGRTCRTSAGHVGAVRSAARIPYGSPGPCRKRRQRMGSVAGQCSSQSGVRNAELRSAGLEESRKQSRCYTDDLRRNRLHSAARRRA
jgi:hypothetical protein